MLSPEQQRRSEGEVSSTHRHNEYRREWRQENFDIYTTLNSRKGPFIEIAGPTPDNYRMVDMQRLDKKVYSSNKYKGLPLFSGQTGEFIGYSHPVDFQADAQNLPMQDGSVGAIFCSCLSTLFLQEGKTTEQATQETKELHEKAIQESYRVLEKEGLLIWEGGTQNDIEYGRHIGFKIVSHASEGDTYGTERHDIIFIKK